MLKNQNRQKEFSRYWILKEIIFKIINLTNHKEGCLKDLYLVTTTNIKTIRRLYNHEN